MTAFAGLRWFRKAESWTEARAWFDGRPPLAPAVLEAAAALPVLLARSRPCALWPEDLPQYFVADAGAAGRFLVDTQGYKYARYVVALPPAAVAAEVR